VLTLLLSTAAAALAVLLLAFLASLITGKHQGVDVAWGLGFAAVAAVSFALRPAGWLAPALTVVWGVRLATHIYRRGRGTDHDDPRYVELLSKAKGNRTWYALRSIYLIQAVSLWFVSLPVQLAAHYTSLSWFSLVGAALWLTGFVFESVGDRQLERFRNDPASRGKVLDTGLWRYTRHPNYFGDACVWWGLFALACVHWTGWLTVLSPLVMTYFLAGKTGKPLLESHLSSTRPGYAEYVARTSGFIPRRPRPGRSSLSK
jgi:steroid 5-alpha reductase family enzyme